MLSEIVTADAPPTAAEVKMTSPEAQAPEGQTAAEGEGEQQHDESGAPKKDSVVPYGALHEERQRRKQWEADAKAKDAQLQQFVQIQAQRDQEWQVAQQRMAQVLAARDQPPAPTKESDPLGYVAHTAEQTAMQVQQLARQQWERDQWQAQQQQQYVVKAQQEQQVHRFVNYVTTAETQFRETHPDYEQALSFAVGQRAKELRAGGWDAEKAQEAAGADARRLAAEWYQRGENPAQRAYAYAQAMGYRPSAPDAEQMHDEGYKASKPSGGGASRGRVSVRQIANMTPTQLARMSDEEFKAAMGG
jgi:hypothetical protein